MRHFAKLTLAVTFVGWFDNGLGTVFWGLAPDFWGVGAFFWILLAEAVALAAVVALGAGRPPVGSGVDPAPEI